VSQNGVLWAEEAGRWKTGIDPVLPADAAPEKIIELDSVSCASAGNCTAVGDYQADSGWFEGLLLTETAGRWATGVKAPLPSNAPAKGDTFINSVSCASAGSCSAVGYYGGDFDSGKGLLLNEKAGEWRTGVEAALPGNAVAGKTVSLTSVSCSSDGNCSAIGTYNKGESSKDNTTPLGVLLTEEAGTWGAGVQALPPKNAVARPAEVDMRAISCTSAGNCVAVGDYVTLTLIESMLLVERAGTWQRGFEAAQPRNPAGGPNIQLSSVSCASQGNCTAVDSVRGLLYTETAGIWSGAIEPPLPENAEFEFSGALDSVSCVSPGNSCSAVGSYKRPSGAGGLLYDNSLNACVVPALKGMTMSAAKRSITSHGCTVGRIKHERSRRIKRNHVVSQQPKPGRRLRLGAKVRLVVSRGP
jgi:hypothetical protein